MEADGKRRHAIARWHIGRDRRYGRFRDRSVRCYALRRGRYAAVRTAQIPAPPN